MFNKLLAKIAKELNKAKIDYIVIGGQALLLYGEPRLTKDIDITLGVDIDELNKVKNILKRLRLKTLVDNVAKFVKETMVLPVEDAESGIRVDFIFSFSLYEKQAIKRANPVRLENTTVNFASLEDVVIHKIVAGRPRDLEDIKIILLKNPKYDVSYIKRWLKEFDASLNETFFVLFKKIEKKLKEHK